MPTPDDLFLSTEPGPRLVDALLRLRTRLRDLGYARTAGLPIPGGPLDVLLDPLNAVRAAKGASNTLYPSASSALFRATRRRRDPDLVGLHELLLLGEPAAQDLVASWLGRELVEELVATDVLRPLGMSLQSQVLVAPYGDEVYLSDPLRLQDHPEFCYLGRSTFTLPDFVSRAQDLPRRGRLLDLGCGAGVGAVACAAGFDEVLGTDVVERCLRFARLNATLAGVPAHFLLSDVLASVDGTFDLVVCNAPCVWSATEPGGPRTYGAGGEDYGLELPARMVRGSLDRLNPGGVLLAVVMAPIKDGEPFLRTALDRILDGRTVQVVARPLMEEFEHRTAALFREHGLTKMVRYLVVLRPAAETTFAWDRWDTPRLLSTRVRTLPGRTISAAVGRLRPAGSR